jgi:hypothetical protein
MANVGPNPNIISPASGAPLIAPPAMGAPLEGVDYLLDVIGFHDPAECM